MMLQCDSVDAYLSTSNVALDSTLVAQYNHPHGLLFVRWHIELA